MFEIFTQAIQGVWSHKMRSFLTMLGIIIGIASIITIVATIRGTSEQIKENLVGSGTNAVTVALYKDDNAYDMSYASPPAGAMPITEELRQELLQIPKTEDVSLFNSRTYASQVFQGSNSFSGTLCGIDPHYFSVFGYQLSYGRSFIESDFSRFRPVMMLDQTAAIALFAGSNPINRTVEVRGIPFTVIGVVEKLRSSEVKISTLADYNTYADTSGGHIFIPMSVWPVLYRFDEPQNVGLRTTTTDDMTAVGKAAADQLTSAVLGQVSGNFSYRANDLSEQARQLQSIANSSNRQLIWIAGISLLVGGIGVMNIMLVTVTERTREIGLRIAIGAKKRFILTQFLAEAAVLTGLGGLLGVLGGFIVSRLMSQILGMVTVFSPPAAVIAVVFSMSIGLLFGLLPAMKAANLNPIDALRRE